MDLVCTEEMKQLLTSPIIKETKPVTNGTTNQQAVDSGIHSDALYQRFSLPQPFRNCAFNAVMVLLPLSFSARDNPKVGCHRFEMKQILHCDWLSEQAI